MLSEDGSRKGRVCRIKGGKERGKERMGVVSTLFLSIPAGPTILSKMCFPT